MHFLSEPSLWITYSEFTDAKGNISRGTGETHIRFTDSGLRIESWVKLEGQTLRNDYLIHPSRDNLYHFESENASMGRQTGTFHIDRDVVYSHFIIEESSMKGFEVVVRDGDHCKGYGALYDRGRLINSWRVVMDKSQT